MPLFLGTCCLEPPGLSRNTVARASPLDMDTAVLRSQAPAGDPTRRPPTPKGPLGEAGLRCVVGTYLSLRSLSQQDCPPPPCPHPAKPVLLSFPGYCMLQPFSSLPSSLKSQPDRLNRLCKLSAPCTHELVLKDPLFQPWAASGSPGECEPSSHESQAPGRKQHSSGAV